MHIMLQTFIFPDIQGLQEVKRMPNWLKNQLSQAFLTKNVNQLKVLNQCWFFYKRKQHSNGG